MRAGFGKRNMSRLLALFIACALLSGCTSGEVTRESSSGSSASTSVTTQNRSQTGSSGATASTQEAPEAEDEETQPEDTPSFAGFPEVGEVVEGFTLLEVREYPLIDAEIGWFSHEESGAKLMYIHNDDTNRVFDLTFLTHSINNEGLPHVFEHATLSGSARFPSKTLFMNLLYQSYNTYMNAMTMDRLTTYPVASLSEQQLLALADYYTDSCFYPMIMEDESIYRTEAWRYRLEDAEDDLTIEGTVYSEMLGWYTKSARANLNAIRASLPGSSICFSYGGDPADIPDMTWDELKDYHDRFYTPDNCIAFLYGDIVEYEAFLRMLDGVFTSYGQEAEDTDTEPAEEPEEEDDTDTEPAEEPEEEDSEAGASTSSASGDDTTDADDTTDTEPVEVSDEEPWFVEEDYTPITASVVEEVPFAVEEGSTTENASVVYYNFVASALGAENSLPLQMLAALLNAEASSLSQNLKEAFPAGVYGCGVEVAGPDLLPMFTIENVNREDAEQFRDMVKEALADVAENGLPEELIDSVMATQSLSNRLIREDEAVGVNLITSFAYGYAITGDPWHLIAQYDAVDEIAAWNADGTFSALAETLLDEEQTLTTLVTTYPEPGLKEQEDAALAEKLAKAKAAMSDEEIETLIRESRTDADDTTDTDDTTDAEPVEAPEEEEDSDAGASTSAASEEEDSDAGASTSSASGDDGTDTEPVEVSDEEDDITAALIQQLKVVEVTDLPEEVREYEVRDETDADENIRYLDAVAGVDGVGYVTLLLDAQSFETEELHDLMLFRNLTDYLDTEKLKRAELDLKLARYTYNPQISMTLLRTDEGAHPYLALGWIANEEDLQDAYDLMRQIVFELDLDDPDRVLNGVKALRAQMRNSYNAAPFQIQLSRAMATYDDLMRFSAYLSGLEYLDYLEDVEEILTNGNAEEKEAVTERLRTVQERLNNRYGAIALFAGNEEGIEANRALADAFFETLESEETTASSYDLPVPESREALIAESNVQYNALVASYEDMGLEEGYSADLDVLSQIVVDQVLLPSLRDRYGAYGAFNVFTEDTGVYLVSYRDPNVRETFDVYEGLGDAVRALSPDQDTIDGYIMSTYVGYAMPAGELSGALESLNNVLQDVTTDDVREAMRKVKEVTPERIAELADLYDRIWEAGRISTSGSAAAINENSDLYDDIRNPFGATDSSELSFTDVPEDHPYYEYVMGLVGMGLIEPLSEDTFGVDEPLSVSDFVFAQYMGMMTAEDGLPALQQAGYLSGLSLEDPLPKSAAVEMYEAVLAAGQVEVEVDWDDYFAGEYVTRGEFARLMMEE